MSDHSASWQTVAPASELLPGQFTEFRLKEKAKEPAGMPLTGFAFLHGTTPRAYLIVCPLLGIDLTRMPVRSWDRDNLFIQCSTHGALFKPGTGECIAGPCQGDALTELEVRKLGVNIEVRVPD